MTQFRVLVNKGEETPSVLVEIERESAPVLTEYVTVEAESVEQIQREWPTALLIDLAATGDGE